MEKIISYIRSSGIYYDSRAIKEIKALAEKGYMIEVIGWDRTGLSANKCQEVFADYIDRVNFHLFDIPVTHLGFKNIIIFLKWMCYIYRKLVLLNNSHKLFAIHSCDFDTGFVAQKYALKNNIHFVYDIFDYYSDSHAMPRLLRLIISYLENKIITESEVTIICTEERREQIKNTHPSKIVVIYNSPDIEEDNKVTKKEYDYVYCGTLADGRLVREILENYEFHSNIKMVFGGTGKYSELCRYLDNKYDNFKYVGVVKYSEVLRLERKSKVISAIYDPSKRNHRLCAPNKFYEALAIGVPVIVCRGTGIDSIVDYNKIGYVINYDVEEFYQSLERLIKVDETSHQINKRSRKIYNAKYKWKYMKEKLIRLYEEL